MEAIGCGCPVVAGDVAGIHDLLGDSAIDVVVRSDDTAALTRAILASLQNPQAAMARADAIRATAAARIDWQRIADRYAGLIAACANRRD